jgi:hypothetical protein
MDNLILAIAMGSGLCLTLLKLFGARILEYEFWVDLLFTFGLPILFSGSFAGGVVSVLAGITLSIELFILKRIHRLFAPSGKSKV